MSVPVFDNGIVTVPTHHSVEQAADRLAALIEAKGLILFARIDFAADAQRAGLDLQPSQLLVFGNPRAGTPLMQAAPTLALDLPLKVLIWRDLTGQVALSYNATDYLQARHDVPAALMSALDGIVALVSAVAGSAPD